jgi:hypothetical protein
MAKPAKKKTNTHPTKAVPGAKRGRPTVYSHELGDKILSSMIQCGSLSAAWRKNKKTWPAESQIYKWIWDGQHKEFQEMYDVARKVLIEKEMDKTLEIADEKPVITKTIFGTNDQGSETWEETDSAGIARNRLRVDARKFFMTKILPKFRDVQDHNVNILNLDQLKKARERAMAR